MPIVSSADKSSSLNIRTIVSIVLHLQTLTSLHRMAPTDSSAVFIHCEVTESLHPVYLVHHPFICTVSEFWSDPFLRFSLAKSVRSLHFFHKLNEVFLSFVKSVKSSCPLVFFSLAKTVKSSCPLQSQWNLPFLCKISEVFLTFVKSVKSSFLSSL